MSGPGDGVYRFRGVAELHATAVGLAVRVEQWHEVLRGNMRRSRYNDAEPMSIDAWLSVVRSAVRGVPQKIPN